MDRRVEALTPADQCLPHLVAEAPEDTAVDRRVEVLIPAGQCLVRLVAAVMEAAETAAGPQVVVHTEATPEGDRVAAPLTEGTITTK